MGLGLSNSVLNQYQSPALYADTLANQPAAGFAGRLFVRTDTPYGIYRDSGSGWTLVASSGGGSTPTLQNVTTAGNVTTLSITALKFIVTGGTSSQFLKGDGSLDSSTYLPLNNPAYTGVLSIGTQLFVPSNALQSLQSSVNSYNQLVITNTNAGSSASVDIVVGNNASTDTTFYGNFGMNSNTFSGSGNFNIANAVYLYAYSGDLSIGTYTNNPIHFIVNNGTIDALTISTAGNLSTPNNITAAKFIVTGGTSSQFLKGDGSLDSTVYATNSSLGSYMPLAGGTFTGNVQFNAANGLSLTFLTGGGFNAILANTYQLYGGVTSKNDFNVFVYSNNPFNVITNNLVRLIVDGSGSVTIGATSGTGSGNLYCGAFGSSSISNTGAATIGTTLSVTGISTFQAGFRSNGYMGLNIDPQANVQYTLYGPMSGGVAVQGLTNQSTIQSSVTTSAIVFLSGASTQAAAFTLGNLWHFRVQRGALGAGSSVTVETGFEVNAITGAATTYGFRGRLASGANQWNMYMDGTAINYINSTLLIGTTIDNGTDKLQVTGNIYSSGSIMSGGAAYNAAYALNVTGVGSITATFAYAINTSYFGAITSNSLTGAANITNSVEITMSSGLDAFAITTSGTNTIIASTLVAASISRLYVNGTAGSWNRLAAWSGNISFGNGISVTDAACIYTGFPKQQSSSGAYTGTVSNFYGILIEDISGNTDIGARVTNRYGIYQKGGSDINFLNGELKMGTGQVVSASVLNTVTNKVKLIINGTTYYLLASTSGT